jgi:hypothetical protein
MEAAVLPFGLVVAGAIISILINTIGYKGILILFGVIAIIVVGYGTAVAGSSTGFLLPPPGFPGAQVLNGGKKHGKKRK